MFEINLRLFGGRGGGSGGPESISESQFFVDRQSEEYRALRKELPQDIISEWGLKQKIQSKQEIQEFFDLSADRNDIVVNDYGEVRSSKATDKAAQRLAEKLADRIDDRNAAAWREYTAVRNDVIKGSYFLSDRDRADIPDFSRYIKDNPTVHVTRDRSALSVDAKYEALAAKYPHLFNAAEHTHPADRLRHINEVLRELRSSGTMSITPAIRRAIAGDIKQDLLAYSYLANDAGRRRK